MSQRVYTSLCEDIKTRYPDLEMLSYDQVKRRVSNLSGVITLKHDMCIDSCAAFIGPLTELANCPCCGKPRYNEKKVTQKVFTMFPLSPQLQACWKSPKAAQKMFYHQDKTHWGQGVNYPVGPC